MRWALRTDIRTDGHTDGKKETPKDPLRINARDLKIYMVRKDNIFSFAIKQ